MSHSRDRDVSRSRTRADPPLRHHATVVLCLCTPSQHDPEALGKPCGRPSSPPLCQGPPKCSSRWLPPVSTALTCCNAPDSTHHPLARCSRSARLTPAAATSMSTSVG